MTSRVAGVFSFFCLFLESLVLFLLYYISEKVYSCREAANSAEETALHLTETAENRPVCNKDVQSLKRPLPSHNDCMCYQSNTCLFKACPCTIVGEKVRREIKCSRTQEGSTKKYTESESYWMWLEVRGKHTENKLGWWDEEGRHGSSKWCSPSTPCQLLGEARGESWHYFVLSTEKIIGLQASLLAPKAFRSDVAKLHTRKKKKGRWKKINKKYTRIMCHAKVWVLLSSASADFKMWQKNDMPFNWHAATPSKKWHIYFIICANLEWEEEKKQQMQKFGSLSPQLVWA